MRYHQQHGVLRIVQVEHQRHGKTLKSGDRLFMMLNAANRDPRAYVQPDVLDIERDERMGWTGDIQVFAPAASGIFDCAGLLASWLADLGAEQQASGGVPFIAYRPDRAEMERRGVVIAAEIRSLLDLPAALA